MKTKKTIINFITDVLPLIVVSLLGIYKLKIFINVLGDETLGLYQLFTQIMIYIALVDGGLSSAVLFSMYKPNSKGDTKGLYSIFLGAKKVFSLIGIIIFLMAAIFSPFAHLLIKDSSFSWGYISLTFLIFSLSNVIGYFFVPYQSLLEVKEKKYINNLCLQIGQIVQSVLEIVMLLTGFKFEIVLLMHVLVKLVSNLIIYLICKKKYPLIKDEKVVPNTSFKKQIGPLLFHKINGLVGSNIDILLISKMLGLANVAIYSAYNYICNMLETILGKISSSMLALIGNHLAKDDNGDKTLYYEITSMMFFIATVICIPLFFAINYFIDIWYEGEIITSALLAGAFSLSTYIYLIKTPTVLFCNANGLFNETKYCALTDTIVNLLLSLILLKILGMSGVVYATAISVFIAEYILKTLVLHRKKINDKPSKYFIHNIKFFVISAVSFGLGIFVFKHIVITNILTWLLVFIAYTLVNGLIVLGAYYMIKEIDFLKRLIKAYRK